MFGRYNHARQERNQRRLDAGLMSDHFPDVAGIVISMVYRQKGLAKPIRRVMNFSPSSYAFFRIDCLSDDCVDGGFDLSRIINSMIMNHSREVKGELGCDDSGPRADHSVISYDIQITFT